jgi:hypothetical protein
MPAAIAQAGIRVTRVHRQSQDIPVCVLVRTGKAVPGPDLPDHDGAEQRQGQNGYTEIEPGSVGAGVLGQNEKVDDEP